MRMWSATMGSRRGRAVGGILLVSVLAAGCGPAAPTDGMPPPPAPAPEILYSNVWSADPGVDLLSRGSELIRASVEAAELTFFVGIDHSYPGYKKAVRGPRNWNDPDFDEHGTWLEPVGSSQRPGTYFRHITDYSVTDSTIKATVCEYRLYPEPAGTLDPLSAAWQVELENAGTTPGQQGVADGVADGHDPRATLPPDWNVFGTWKVEKLRSIAPAYVPQGCMGWWHEQFPTFAHISKHNILNAPPGFVEPTMPVAVQYPEWIAPVNG